MNIVYKSDGFSKYYGAKRHVWDEFYLSERYIMSRFMDELNKPFSVLDVGCGCGGLGYALQQKYKLSMYKGVDINQPNIEVAQRELNLGCPYELVCEDIVKMKGNEVYDFVISFSCIDFNIEVKEMLDVCWNKVREGGKLILSARLTNQSSVNDIGLSYQPIGENSSEVANYVVFNVYDFLRLIKTLPNLGGITGYGYWGKPSSSAHTPYDKLCFSCVCLEKEMNKDIKLDMKMPLNLFI